MFDLGDLQGPLDQSHKNLPQCLKFRAQMLGTVSMHRADDRESSRDFAGYRERFPECEPLLGDPELRFWTLRVHWIKYTDNTVRFGHKEIWSRS